jgi:hypothetical protein
MGDPHEALCRIHALCTPHAHRLEHQFSTRLGQAYTQSKDCFMAKEPVSRGDWAEGYVRDFLSLPLVSEFVFHSVQTHDVTQKEVADFLIHYPGVGILISQKAQQGPFSREASKNASWVLKKTYDAISQLRGALREPKRPMWCIHPRRGRIDLPEGLPSINHGIVLTETFKAVDLNPQAADLPLEYKGVAITYLSLNDFLHVAMELRTVPELLAYLDARRCLPYTDLRTIGDERALLELYYLQKGSLAGCVGKADAAVVAAASHADLNRALHAKWEHDQYSRLIEHVAAQLSTRRKDYAEGLSALDVAHYDDPNNRKGYLRLQATLADLRLRERAEIGQAFSEVMEKRRAAETAFMYKAAHLDTRPEWVYVLASSAGLDPQELENRKNRLLVGAVAFYRKTNCLLILDRNNGGSYEIGLVSSLTPPSSPIERALGDELFGRLKMTDKPLNLIPL